MNQDTLYKITGAILVNYIANHYNEEIKHTPVYKQRLKQSINTTIKELTKAEVEYFDKVSEIDDQDWSDKLSANLMKFIDVMIRDQNFPDFCKLQEIVVAYTINPKSISGISDKILKQHNNGKHKQKS